MLTIDLSENKVLGPAYNRGQIDLLRRLIEFKFGALPSWAEQRLAECSDPALETIALRVFDAAKLEDLLR